MAFIDEVNAVDLGQRMRTRVPFVVVGLLAALLVGGVVIIGALQPPFTVIEAADGGQEQAADSTSDAKKDNESLGGVADNPSDDGVHDTDVVLEPSGIVVHVGGCVAVPGVYEVAADARLDDAVQAAGGMTADAAVDAVNLAAHLEDGQQVIVPSCDQVAEGQWSQTQAGAQTISSAAEAVSGGASAAPLNVNQATADQLTQLNGIGVALAQRIVDDRDKNGPFASVDDLTRVSGIGKKKLEGFREDVCV